MKTALKLRDNIYTTMEQELKFLEPRPKGRQHGTVVPFPVLPTNDLYYVDGEAPVFSGVFNGYCVIVSDAEDMTNLYRMGCFGKGSQSKSSPVFEETSVSVAEPEEDQKPLPEPMEVKEAEKPCDSPQPLITLEINSKGKSGTKIDKKEYRFTSLPLDPVHEELHLSLEEAFFLCFGLDCLEVDDTEGNRLSLRNMWEKFRKAQVNFVEKYVAYHHFRSKGWVVRPGHRFGGDYILYKKGPAYFHASFIVVVEVVNEEYLREQPITWGKMIAMNRLSMATGKDLLLCQIKGPRPTSEIDELEMLSQFEVNEVLVRKWKE